MASQLNTKSHQNKVVQIREGLQNNAVNSAHIKEEIALIKIEDIDELSNDINCQNDIFKYDLIKVEDETFTNADGNEQVNYSKSQNQIRSPILEYSGKINDPPNYCKNEEEHQPDILSKNNISKASLVELNPSNKHSDALDQSSMDLSEYCDTSKKTTKSRPKKRKNKLTEYYIKHYATRVELMDNPDCQRIITMGLSKKEKDQASVLCRECGKTVTFRYYVEVHARAHIGMKPFKCGVCNASFAKEDVLKKHRLVHKDTKNFSCNICGKSFRTSQAVENHKKSHSDERPYQCSICDKRMKYKETLKQHILTHGNKKTHTCELCGKSFINSAGLIRHKHTHNTEKTFVCAICEKAFKSKRLLDYHAKQHSDNKPYVCSYCDNRFKCNSVLQSHILIHTGEKPFSCKICNKAFRQRPSLRHHMRTHTGETPFQCNLCESKFKYQQQLTNHRKVHKNKSSQQ